MINAFTKRADVSVMTVHPSQRDPGQSTAVANEGSQSISSILLAHSIFCHGGA